MTKPKKGLKTMTTCAQIQETESVEELRHFIGTADVNTLGFRLRPDDWEDVQPEDLIVLETLVVRLRELIQAGKLSPESGKPSPKEPDYDL
jgi:hypothetical protein